MLGTSGCLLASIASKPPVPTPHPLKSSSGVSWDGAPLTLSGLTHESCDRWPFEDSVRVEVSEAEVCVDWVQTYGQLGPNPSRTFLLESNTGEQQLEFENNGAARKIAQCYRDDAGSFDLWQAPLRACSPNEGLIAADTTELELKRRGLLVSLLSFSFTSS